MAEKTAERATIDTETFAFLKEETPWTSFDIPLSEAKICIVTTAGVHHTDQEPFDMNDKDGDPSFRVITPADKNRALSLKITHDYYDHSDADKDMNIVFPIDRLGELKEEGVIGGVTKEHFGFMGHIDGRHIDTFITKTAPEVARLIKATEADAVLLTPG